jgi:hypothetical protein
MATTSMMTLRIDRTLLAELKARARNQSRSTSAEVVFILRKSLQLTSATARRSVQKPSMGMFAQFDAPSKRSLADARETLSASLSQSIQASAVALGARPRGATRTVKRKP